MSDRVVFDTEPLVAFIANEEGGDTVEGYLDCVEEGDLSGFVSPVTLTEVHYIASPLSTEKSPDDFITDLQAAGVRRVSASDCWRDAARYKGEHQVALGDAYSLATAAEVDGTLLVGGDDDFDEITDVDIRRFREGAA